MAEGLSRAPGVVWIEIDGDVVAVSAQTQHIHVLEGAASVVWQLLDGEPLDGLDAMLAETFGIPVDEAASGVSAAVDLLEAADIVERTITTG
jgi:gentisate 1,2-dioxygenase